MSGIAVQIFPSSCNNYSLLLNPKTPSKNILVRHSLLCRRSRRVLYLTRFPFLSFFLEKSFFLSGNTSFSHTSLHPILTKLGQSDRYLDHYSHTKDGGVRGHPGVTGVKKVIFTKKASSPSDYIALTRDLHAYAIA